MITYVRHSFLFLLLILPLLSCAPASEQSTSADASVVSDTARDLSGYSRAYFASGCFWCVEAIFESVQGVEEAISGYAGGKIANPTYQQVSRGQTRHAEAVEVYYDPAIIDYQTLLVVFFDSHDPTTLNRQGPDRGPQYRSAIFYQNEEEKQMAEAYIADLEASGSYDDPIVTEVVPLTTFWEAEDYHQDYEQKNPNNSYIQAVSIPRLKRFQKKHPELLKEDAH